MNYEDAKKRKEELNKINEADFKSLRAFDKSKGIIKFTGLIPNDIRNIPERKKLEQKYLKSFSEYQAFNKYFVTQFKNEYKNERRNRKK